MNKQDIRKEVFNIRKSISKEFLILNSSVIEDKILTILNSSHYDIILSYADFGKEVRTEPLNKHLISLGYKLFLPRVTDKDKSLMEFYLVNDYEELVKDHYGILEPLGNTERFDYAKEKEKRVLMLVPGVAFDRRLNRTGYGKGFYDNYLSGKDSIHKIALSFDYQLIDFIDTNDSDISMDEIITEKENIR